MRAHSISAPRSFIPKSSISSTDNNSVSFANKNNPLNYVENPNFSEELKTLMTGFGDNEFPDPESIELLQEYVIEYIQNVSILAYKKSKRKGNNEIQLKGWADRNANAILEAWYPGAHGGTAVAQVLLGEYNPGGKLTVTFPRTVGQIPFNFPFKPNSQVDGYVGVGPEGKKTRAAGALYDFGYGLSYTTFEYSDMQLSSSRIMPGDSLTVSCVIKNTGSRKGDEISQLYIHDLVSSITVYDRMLRGFERITLEPGESRKVEFKLGPEDFTMLDRNLKPVIEPGLFEIYIGASSVDLRLGDMLTMQDPADPLKTFSTGNAALAGVLPITLNAGEEVTFSLKPDVAFKKFDLQWRMDTNCKYKVQLNLGGGQFQTLLEMSATGGSQKPRFSGDYKASDLRILVTEGRGTITDFDCLAL